MLTAMRIKDLAIIEDLEVEFGPNFTILTGETGAGKSILVDALTMTLGARAVSELIRSGAKSAEVEAVFDISKNKAVSEFLKSSGLFENCDENAHNDDLIIRRVISQNGKNRVWINGKNESVATLFKLGRHLVDIYGQHEYQTLLKPENHISLLDSFGGLKNVLKDYKKVYKTWKDLNNTLNKIDIDETQKAEREDLLRYRINEIASAQIEVGEDDLLEKERDVLRHAEEILEIVGKSVDILYDSDEAVVGVVQNMENELSRAGGHDSGLLNFARQMTQAGAVLEDAAQGLRTYLDSLEADPERLSWIDDRLDELKKLKRKYGDTLEEILENQKRSQDELDDLEKKGQNTEELKAKIKETEKEVVKKGQVLSKERKKKAKELGDLIEKEVAALGMEKTMFEARITKISAMKFGSLGEDEVEFYISPNPGEDMKPLIKIASGGELSRIMLALRVVLRESLFGSTLIFDEVDQGVGGAVAEALGLRMKKLAKKQQVLCVTHLPQIAALAENHILVSKIQEKEKTWTETKKLEENERTEEVARMLGGKKLTETTRTHAMEMIAQGKKIK
jgi:DNA repair protein RecN (Recombination protein N)